MTIEKVVGIIGYGEVGRIFAEDLRAQNITVCAYDRKLGLSPDEGQPLREHAAKHGVTLAADSATVASIAGLVFSAVTASQTVNVATALAPTLGQGTFVIDVNSASPGAKKQAASVIDGVGGRYVEAAVMTSVPPYRTKVPMLLGGPHSDLGLVALTGLGFAAQVASSELGLASATKMARSVMIKGLEAMVIESFTTARHYGVEDQLIASLDETFPGVDWDHQATYFFQRVIQHGRRRAEEVREVARTVEEAGLHPWSATATSSRHDWVADMVADGQFGNPAIAAVDEWRNNADKLLGAQMMTSAWLPFHPSPSKPQFQLPAGAVDAHCHVFGPSSQFPFAPQRKYTPCDAGKEQLFALRDHLGFSRNVIVQATCHGNDNRALLDALVYSNGMARGVVSLDPSVTDEELRSMHAAGVRGARFNFVKRLVDFTPREVLTELAARIAPLGWHVVVYFEAADLLELEDFFTSLPTPVVVDHMGRPDIAMPPDGPEFARFISFMENNAQVWAKVSCPERLSLSGPPALLGQRYAYRDVVPFARTLVERFPDRVLWGTDWPHPNLNDHMPDDGLLVDYLPSIAPTAELQRKLLVDNPMRLYWNKKS
jgi:2-pyrone-4,6-dicarboxylate lactonase